MPVTFQLRFRGAFMQNIKQVKEPANINTVLAARLWSQVSVESIHIKPFCGHQTRSICVCTLWFGKEIVALDQWSIICEKHKPHQHSIQSFDAFAQKTENSNTCRIHVWIMTAVPVWMFSIYMFKWIMVLEETSGKEFVNKYSPSCYPMTMWRYCMFVVSPLYIKVERLYILQTNNICFMDTVNWMLFLSKYICVEAAWVPWLLFFIAVFEIWIKPGPRVVDKIF